MVHQRDIGRVVQRGTFGNQAHFEQQLFGVLVPLLCQKHLVRFFIDRVVAGLGHAFTGSRIRFTFLLNQQRHHLVHGDIHLGVVFGLATDDERCTGLVDQDGVHLVDDGKVQAALNAVRHFVHHVVSQVVKTELVVGAVGDIGQIGLLLLFTRHVGQIDAHSKPQEVIQLAHPPRIPAGQIVVDGDHMHALSSQCVEVDR